MSDASEVTVVAYAARELSRQNASDIAAHEDLCAERYKNIHDRIDEIKVQIAKSDSRLGWAGGIALSVILGLLAFLAQAQFTSNEQARRDQQLRADAQQQRIELLQQQLSHAGK